MAGIYCRRQLPYAVGSVLALETLECIDERWRSECPARPAEWKLLRGDVARRAVPPNGALSAPSR